MFCFRPIFGLSSMHVRCFHNRRRKKAFIVTQFIQPNHFECCNCSSTNREMKKAHHYTPSVYLAFRIDLQREIGACWPIWNLSPVLCHISGDYSFLSRSLSLSLARFYSFALLLWVCCWLNPYDKYKTVSFVIYLFHQLFARKSLISLDWELDACETEWKMWSTNAAISVYNSNNSRSSSSKSSEKTSCNSIRKCFYLSIGLGAHTNLIQLWLAYFSL